MVRVIDYRKIQKDSGEEFNMLIISGGIEMTRSKTSGKYYATMRKASVPSTFNEVTCQSLIGQQMPGTVAKVPCDDYEILDKKTGEIITLNHRYEFIDESQSEEEAILESEVLV